MKTSFYSKLPSAAKGLAEETFWHMPARFGLAHVLDPSYSLRCLVFHNISSAASPFTAGINVSTCPEEFETALRFLKAHYNPVRLDDVLASFKGQSLPERAVLVTFDDGYASMAEIAAPLCRQLEVPAVFFINAAFLDNRRLAPDNLVCYVANQFGMEIINAAAQAVRGDWNLHSLTEVFRDFFPALTLTERGVFLEALRRMAGINHEQLAQMAGLYMTSGQLRALTSFGFEIGNHTYNHVHCRVLSSSEAALEIEQNKEELEAISRSTVRSFSLPYGLSKDLTGEVRSTLARSGHKAVFLSESVANHQSAQWPLLDRVNPRTSSEATLFFELEVMPRLRVIRNRIFKQPSAMMMDGAQQVS